MNKQVRSIVGIVLTFALLGVLASGLRLNSAVGALPISRPAHDTALFGWVVQNLSLD